MKKNKTKKKYLNKARLFVILTLTFLYIFQVTEMTKDLYKIRSYDRKISQIYEESRRAEYGFLKSNSITKTEELVKNNNFVRAKEVHYINLSDFEIASR